MVRLHAAVTETAGFWVLLPKYHHSILITSIVVYNPHQATRRLLNLFTLVSCRLSKCLLACSCGVLVSAQR